jgi:HSP20 family protein
MATLKCLFHPHHISLLDTHSFRSRLNNIGDPYHNIDGLQSHRHLLAPKFDIFESETSYILVGELPGVKAKAEITYEWLEDQTLFIRGHVAAETATKSTEGGEGKDSGAGTWKPLHVERSVGDFERSFTFPGKVVTEGMEVELGGGLLRIVVLKVKV